MPITHQSNVKKLLKDLKNTTTSYFSRRITRINYSKPSEDQKDKSEPVDVMPIISHLEEDAIDLQKNYNLANQLVIT